VPIAKRFCGEQAANWRLAPSFAAAVERSQNSGLASRRRHVRRSSAPFKTCTLKFRKFAKLPSASYAGR
jgi:hypothetical protein